MWLVRELVGVETIFFDCGAPDNDGDGIPNESDNRPLISNVEQVDLDGDGNEQTGWNLLYLHVSNKQVKEGDFMETGDLIGRPSCEGGIASGSHLHFARKYNGEWILADGPLPFNLSGWVAQAGLKPYQGALIRGDEVVLACSCASRQTNISR